MGNKTRLITPFFMLLAGAIASIIMYVRHYELMRSLKVLLLVLVIFYILGDILRYIYATIRPRIIPDMTLDDIGMEFRSDNIVTKEQDAGDQESPEAQEGDAQPEEDEAQPQMADATEEEGYTDEDLTET